MATHPPTLRVYVIRGYWTGPSWNELKPKVTKNLLLTIIQNLLACKGCKKNEEMVLFQINGLAVGPSLALVPEEGIMRVGNGLC